MSPHGGSTALAKLDKARQMLAESRTLGDVKKIRDIAESARVYAKAAHLGQKAQNYAAEIALLAARKAGEILKQLEKKRHSGVPASVSGTSEYAAALEESATKQRTAQRWQELSAIPEKIVNAYLEEAKTLETDISSAGLLKKAKKIAAAKNPKPITVPEKPQVSAALLTARLAELRVLLGDMNIFTKQLQFSELDEPSQQEIYALVKSLREISKDAAERADRLQAKMPAEVAA